MPPLLRSASARSACASSGPFRCVRARYHLALVTSLQAHFGWTPAPDRRKATDLLLEQERLQRRDEDLLPVRHGRMAKSAFAFFRGAARVFAHDLRDSPTSGLDHFWICGDAHLCNFGMFASQERSLVFGVFVVCCASIALSHGAQI